MSELRREHLRDNLVRKIPFWGKPDWKLIDQMVDWLLDNKASPATGLENTEKETP